MAVGVEAPEFRLGFGEIRDMAIERREVVGEGVPGAPSNTSLPLRRCAIPPSCQSTFTASVHSSGPSSVGGSVSFRPFLRSRMVRYCRLRLRHGLPSPAREPWAQIAAAPLGILARHHEVARGVLHEVTQRGHARPAAPPWPSPPAHRLCARTRRPGPPAPADSGNPAAAGARRSGSPYRQSGACSPHGRRTPRGRGVENHRVSGALGGAGHDPPEFTLAVESIQHHHAHRRGREIELLHLKVVGEQPSWATVAVQ